MVMNYIAILLLVLLAFTIGLNLGLHGVMDFHLSFMPYVRKEVKSEVLPITHPITHHDSPQGDSGPSKAKTVVVSPPLSTPSSKDVEETDHSKVVTNEALAKIQRVLDEVTDEVLAHDSAYKQAVLTSPEPNIPVILLTYNRPQLLDITLQSLLTTVVGLPKNLIYILQDGQDEEVLKVCQKYGLNVHQNKRNLRIRDGKLPH